MSATIDQLRFRPLDLNSAQRIAAWRYPPPYDLYNVAEAGRAGEAARLAASRYFGVFDANDSLVAFRCFGEDARVPGFDYDDSAVDTGGGLRPDLTGQGLGTAVIAAGLAFGGTLFGDVGFRVTVASFNQRARRVLERLGFVLEHRFTAPAGTSFGVLRRPC